MTAASLGWAYQRLHEGINYRLRTFAGGRLASACRPTSIALLFTERCNARCVHCDIWKNKGREEALSAEEWKTVLSEIRDWLGPVRITLTGGEALLRPYTPELVTHGGSLGLFVEVLTHGWWEDQARIEQLARANPWRVTISLDGVGETHSKIRGRAGFFEKTNRTIDTLLRLRAEEALKYQIRLKTVVMEHNLDELEKVAEFATREGVHVFYQPIEQNYNTVEDPMWFTSSPNWPRDTAKAVRAVEGLIALKRQGRHIDNSYAQLKAMIPYFRAPETLRLTTQFHSAHERKTLCSALITLQLQPNGDVQTCTKRGPIGNVRQAPLRQIWRNRPRWWESGCCLDEPPLATE